MAGAFRPPRSRGLVRNHALQLLQDEARIAGWIMQHASAGLVRSGVANTGSLTALLSADHQREVLQLMFRSIVLTTSAIRFEVCVRAIVQRLLGEAESKEPTHPESDRLPEMVMIDLPVTLRRRGAGMRIVIDSPYSRPEPDPSLVDLIARAHVYMSRLTGSSTTGTRSIGLRGRSCRCGAHSSTGLSQPGNVGGHPDGTPVNLPDRKAAGPDGSACSVGRSGSRTAVEWLHSPAGQHTRYWHTR